MTADGATKRYRAFVVLPNGWSGSFATRAEAKAEADRLAKHYRVEVEAYDSRGPWQYVADGREQ